MKLEVQYAVDFLMTLLRKKCKNANQVEHFRLEMTNLLLTHIGEHWYPGNSNRGSAYRCIRIQSLKIDPMMMKAAHICGFNTEIFSKMFPEDFTLWIDPYDVSYRIGEYGSCSPLYYIPDEERPPQHRPKARRSHGTPKRSESMKIKNTPTSEGSPDSGSPMSISPPSPTYAHTNSCNQSLQEDSSDSCSSMSMSPPSSNYAHTNSCKSGLQLSLCSKNYGIPAYVTG